MMTFPIKFYKKSIFFPHGRENIITVLLMNLKKMTVSVSFLTFEVWIINNHVLSHVAA